MEHHLQHYGIHRDASDLLQSIEFAKAVRRLTPEKAVAPSSLYQAIKGVDQALRMEEPVEAMQAFITNNVAIYAQYEKDEQLQEKILRNAQYLALTYAKVEAIQGLVEQDFAEYDTAVLGNPEGNNKNFTLTVSDTEKLVIRVEDRTTLGGEQQLQLHEVSDYFSEDYATIMVPVKEDGEIEYRPVVVSQLARGGDLEGHAKKMVGEGHPVKIREVQQLFTQLSDFCVKLQDSGHYHPDIKLSNFLIDNEKIVVSDRKTITANKTPRVRDICSSPLYAAPEFQQCINEEGNGLNLKMASRTVLDMPSYMSYQMGMALKEFVFKSNLVPFDENSDESWDAFINWGSISSRVENPSKELQNISVLIEELTRSKPEEDYLFKT